MSKRIFLPPLEISTKDIEVLSGVFVQQAEELRRRATEQGGAVTWFLVNALFHLDTEQLHELGEEIAKRSGGKYSRWPVCARMAGGIMSDLKQDDVSVEILELGEGSLARVTQGMKHLLLTRDEAMSLLEQLNDKIGEMPVNE